MEIDQFAQIALLSLYCAVDTGKVKCNNAAANAFLNKKIIQALKSKPGKSLKADLQTLQRKIETSKRDNPKDVYAQFDTYTALLDLYQIGYEASASAGNDFDKLLAATNRLQEFGYSCLIGEHVETPIENLDKVIVVLKEHLTDSFNGSGALTLPCSVMVCGDIDPVVDAFDQSRLLIFLIEQRPVNGIMHSHLQLIPGASFHKSLNAQRSTPLIAR